MLGIPSRAVAALVEQGVLATSEQLHRVVPRKDFEQFRSRYIKQSEAAETFGTSSRAVLPRLEALGVQPALTRAECHTPFYAREQISALRADLQGRLQE